MIWTGWFFLLIAAILTLGFAFIVEVMVPQALLLH